MKIRLFYPAFDPGAVEGLGDIDERFLFQGTFYKFDGPLLDGLVSERVALIDFNPVSGALESPMRVLPPEGGQKLHQLDVREKDLIARPRSVASIATLCFGTVMRTLYLVERSLGTEVTWAFDGKQLLVVPRAGYKANAFYERSSHSLQFFFVPGGGGAPATNEAGEDLNGVYTALSPDIVSHETAHALIDALAPYLHHAASPESLALHEAIADLTALIFSLHTPHFLTYIVEKHGDDGDLDAAYIGEIAEEVGKLRSSGSPLAGGAGDDGEARHYLRNLSNSYALRRRDGMEVMRSIRPHDLSQVLSGALFDFFEVVYKDARERRKKERHVNSDQAAALAIYWSAEILTNMIYRALDYLPPGEISFADFGRAMLAADRIYMPSGDKAEIIRDQLATELERRGICNKKQLDPSKLARLPDLSKENLERFVDESNDWQIYEFVRRFARLFCLPDNTVFKVHDAKLFREKTIFEPAKSEVATALDKSKARFEARDAGGDPIDDETEETERPDEAIPGGKGQREKRTIRELLIKISWKRTELVKTAGGSERDVEFRFGTTVSIDLDKKIVLARLTTNPDGFPDNYYMASQSHQQRARAALIEDWYERGILVGSSAFDDEDGMKQPRMVSTNGVYELRNMAHMLHIADDKDVFLADWMQADEDEGEVSVRP